MAKIEPPYYPIIYVRGYAGQNPDVLRELKNLSRRWELDVQGDV